MPALHRLLRHAHARSAPPNRPRRRESSSAVRRCRGPAERVRRSDSRVQLRHRRRSAPARRRRDAVLRRVGEQLPVRGARARRRAADRRRRRRRQGARAARGARPRARIARTISSAALASNVPSRAQQSSENRVRITATTLEPFYEDAALLMSALDQLEATAALDQASAARSRQAAGRRRRWTSPGSSRRAGELRDELRFVLKARRARLRLFSRNARPRAVPARGADRRLHHRPRCAVRSHEGDGADIGHADGRGHRSTTSAAGSGSKSPGATRFLKLPSEFDYARQAILYLPRRMPDPRSADFTAAAAREIISILEATQGRAFVLFTSYAAMRAVQAIAEIELPLSDSGAGHRRRARRCSSSSARRRTPCCWPRRASGRGWM